MSARIGPPPPPAWQGALSTDKTHIGGHNGHIFRAPSHGMSHTPTGSGRLALAPRRPPPPRRRPRSPQDAIEDGLTGDELRTAQTLQEARLRSAQDDDTEEQRQSHEDSSAHQGQRSLDAIFRFNGAPPDETRQHKVANLVQRFRFAQENQAAPSKASQSAAHILQASELPGASLLTDTARMASMPTQAKRAFFVDVMLAISTSDRPAPDRLKLRLAAIACMRAQGDGQPITLTDVKQLVMEGVARMAERALWHPVRPMSPHEALLQPLEILSALRPRPKGAAANAADRSALVLGALHATKPGMQGRPR